jgi:hypothetical protein
MQVNSVQWVRFFNMTHYLQQIHRINSENINFILQRYLWLCGTIVEISNIQQYDIKEL